MNLIEEIRYRSGFEEVLSEGIKFFKNSQRIKKIIDKAKKSLIKIKDEQDKKDVEEYIERLEESYSKFDEVEKEFEQGLNKKESKAKYKALVKEFSSIVSTINKNSVKYFLINTGVAYLLFLSTATFFVMGLSPSNAQYASSIEKIKENNNLMRGNESINYFNKNEKLIEDMSKIYERIQ